MTTDTTTAPPEPGPGLADRGRQSPIRRAIDLVLSERVPLLAVLLVLVVGWFFLLSNQGYLVAPYDSDYLFSALDSLVPLCLLAFAELVVIVSGRGGIDLSVGSIVSLCGMAFGFMVGLWNWPVLAALVVTVAVGAALGAINGLLVAYLGFPALIATLATFYAFGALALLSHNNAPISTKPIQDVHSLTRTVSLPLGDQVPDVPLQVLTFLLPVAVVVWLVVNRTAYGRKLYAIGTNDIAARFANIPVRRSRFLAYVASGALSGLAAVVIVAQFASARPDSGSVGNGMALPAITIAVLGGVAIVGGVGRVAGVILAGLLVVWLNAGILLAFEGSDGSQFQLFALGALLVLSALLNAYSLRRGRGAG
ncbi:MAG: rhamnose transport system permease protein [Actinomycetota bacterium]|jgi:ribose transport system permease protein/erythritol transport system permease protein|nr:rhamnose transport system permease protein [Actinomycetota bacterium]MDQ1666959.1 rhamnose transport system permease protein [Actinomycetota bacterium]MDQ1670544.1 rhamnose transport system permease protein [Actinomycetota bacterium]